MKTSLGALCLFLGPAVAFQSPHIQIRSTTSLDLTPTRRDFFAGSAAASLAVLTSAAVPASAASLTAADGPLSDLPPDAAKSYLQYRVALQVATDYFLFELQEMVADPEQWGEVSQVFAASNARGGQGQPSRVERDFVNPMRIIGLTMPPDVADNMRESQFSFEQGMQRVTKATSGYRRDLSVELDPKNIDKAKEGYEQSRKALNSFLATLNEATGLQEMRTIPAPGPNQFKEYGRSQRRYLDLMKKTKLCQNRGGPTLSQTWGQLMVTGYLQDSCGIPDMDDYFYQTKKA